SERGGKKRSRAISRRRAVSLPGRRARALTGVAPAGGRGLDVAGGGEAERARPVDLDAAEGGGGVAADRGAEALRLGLHHGLELRAARGAGRRRAVAAD